MYTCAAAQYFDQLLYIPLHWKSNKAAAAQLTNPELSDNNHNANKPPRGRRDNSAKALLHGQSKALQKFECVCSYKFLIYYIDFEYTLLMIDASA